jgi:hypothetical protein
LNMEGDLTMKALSLSLIAATALSLSLAGSAFAQQQGGGGGGAGGGGRGAIAQACGADFQKLCPDAQGPARRQCLQDNQTKLSEGCKAALAALPAPGGAGGATPAGGGK